MVVCLFRLTVSTETKDHLDSLKKCFLHGKKFLQSITENQRKTFNQVPNKNWTDIVLVAKINSLQRLPHYTFQLTLRNPAENQRQMHEQGNIDRLVRNETKHIAGHNFLICCSSDLKQKVEALSTPGSRCICLIAAGPLL